jgi:hypothetical protein
MPVGSLYKDKKEGFTASSARVRAVHSSFEVECYFIGRQQCFIDPIYRLSVYPRAGTECDVIPFLVTQYRPEAFSNILHNFQIPIGSRDWLSLKRESGFIAQTKQDQSIGQYYHFTATCISRSVCIFVISTYWLIFALQDVYFLHRMSFSHLSITPHCSNSCSLLRPII